MMANIEHVVSEKPSESLLKTIEGIFRAHNQENQITPYDKKPMAIELQDGEKIIGGVEGYTAWSWLHIEKIAIEKKYRGGGYGQKLLELAEKEAVKKGCVGIYLSTMSFQAPDFYKKAGFEEYGCIGNNPVGHKRLFFKKELVRK